MRPFLPRGQAAAKGILHTEQRLPLWRDTGADGTVFDGADPRGYWTGQHTNPRRNERRARIKAVGGIRQFKRRAHAAQEHRHG